MLSVCFAHRVRSPLLLGLQQGQNVTHKVRVEARDVEPGIVVFLCIRNLVFGLLEKACRVANRVIFSINLVLQIFDLAIEVLQLINDAVVLPRLLLKSRFFGLDLIQDVFKLFSCLFSHLLGPCSALLCVLKLSLQVIAARFEVVDRLDSLRRLLLILLLEIAIFVEKLVETCLCGLRVTRDGS